MRQTTPQNDLMAKWTFSAMDKIMSGNKDKVDILGIIGHLDKKFPEVGFCKVAEELQAKWGMV